MGDPSHVRAQKHVCIKNMCICAWTNTYVLRMYIELIYAFVANTSYVLKSNIFNARGMLEEEAEALSSTVLAPLSSTHGALECALR